jgi:hypothetical protein
MSALVIFFDGTTEYQTVNTKEDIQDLIEFYGSSVEAIISKDGSKTFFKRK